MKSGSIPKTIRVFARPETTIKFKWDDIDVTDDVAENLCKPIFVTDATNKKTQATAKAWASREQYHWDPVTGKRTKTGGVFEEFERPNTPMTGLRIIGLVIRGQGGRAYQVLVDDKYVFDLREDVLLDAMLNDGMGKNGCLFGSYIFAAVGSEMKLVRVGSLLHEKMIEATDYNTLKKITDLEVGGIYRNKKSTVLYLGPVYTRHYEVLYEEEKRTWDSWRYAPRVAIGSILRRETKIFLTIDINEKKKMPKTIRDVANGLGYYSLNWVHSKPTSFREKVGQLNGSLQDMLDTLKEHIGATIQKEELERRSYSLNMSATPGYVHPLFKDTPQEK